MKIIIGLVTIDNKEMLEESLASLYTNTKDTKYDVEIAIINNGGAKKDWLEIIEKYESKRINSGDKIPPITGWNMKERISLAAAWNIILKLKSDYTVITNDDILYSPKWLDNLIDSFEGAEGVGILQPFNTLSVKPKNYPNNYKLEDRYGEIPSDNFRGCCFAISREAVNKMKEYEKDFKDEPYKGLFDEDLYPFGSEDQDYYIRMNKAGLKFQTCFNSYIHHYTGVTMNMLYSIEEFSKIVKDNASKLHKKHEKRGDIWIGTMTS